MSNITTKDADPSIQWPSIKPKNSLTIKTILQDQIYVIDDLFSSFECQQFVEFGKGLKMEGPKLPGRGEATRTNRTCPSSCTYFIAAWLPLIAGFIAFVSSRSIRNVFHDVCKIFMVGPFSSCSIDTCNIKGKPALSLSQDPCVPLPLSIILRSPLRR